MDKNKIYIEPYPEDDEYDDDDIPEIDLPKRNEFPPDEVPYRDFPDGL